jgi:hypothetical protein
MNQITPRLKELDTVQIPEAVAAERRLYPTGTVVWYVPPASFATVECRPLDQNTANTLTVLLDIGVDELTVVKE